jgi:uncharacterized phiE125 gp8 family phage protein
MITLKTAPIDGPVEIEEVKSHLRIDSTDEDYYLQSLINSARNFGEGFQNRAYNTQTWELWLDDFPSDDFISLPRPPLQSVSSVKYYGTDNTEYTMSSADYFVDSKSEPGRVCLGYGKTWPTTSLRSFNGVCVTYVAGYAGQVPGNIKQAMLLLIGHWYENRESVSQVDLKPVPMTVDTLLWQDRVL